MAYFDFSDKKIGSIVGDLEVIEALASKLKIDVLSIELSLSHFATLFVTVRLMPPTCYRTMMSRTVMMK